MIEKLTVMEFMGDGSFNLEAPNNFQLMKTINEIIDSLEDTDRRLNELEERFADVYLKQLQRDLEEQG